MPSTSTRFPNKHRFTNLQKLKRTMIMTEIMIYELKNLMKNTKTALEIANYYGELPTFVDELNQQADPKEMTI